MIQKLPIALAQSEMKSDKSYILYIKQEKLLKKYIPIHGKRLKSHLRIINRKY